MEKGSWLGLGLGTYDMSSGADMIQIDSDSRLVLDRTSVGYEEPEDDDIHNLEATFDEIETDAN